MSMAAAPFFERLAERCRAKDSLLCVGLDPHVSELPEPTPEAAFKFCEELVEATKDVAVAYKPNAAFFEQFGAAGWQQLKRLIEHIRRSTDGAALVVLDAKRGDIGSTAQAYAKSAYEVLGADSITVNPYMGKDSMEPFLSDSSRGVWALCKTSNKGSDDIQTCRLGDGTLLYHHVAKVALESTDRGPASVGLVVGATDTEAMRSLRQSLPCGVWFLAPGIGAQGGDLEAAVRAGLDRQTGMGILFPVSRGISKAADRRAAAIELNRLINEARSRSSCAAMSAENAGRPKIVLVPGNGGGGDIRPANFYGWFEKQMLDRGYEVKLPEGGMPDPVRARRSIWIPYIRDTLKCDENTVLVGHSSGAVAALRLAEEQKLRGIVLIAVYDDPLGDSMEAASGYFDGPFDWSAIQNNCGFIVQIGGTEDTLVPIDVQRRVARMLRPKVEYVEVPGEDHFFVPPFGALVDAVTRHWCPIPPAPGLGGDDGMDVDNRERVNRVPTPMQPPPPPPPRSLKRPRPDGQEPQNRDELENRYELCEKLGEGTYGKVYRGMDKVTREPVAIKRMKINLEDEGCPSLAIREIALLRKIRSANVVSLLHIHADRGSSSPWDSLTLVFELLTYDLRQFIKRNSIPSAPCLKYFVYQILRGVKACHELRIMHRDIKPQNLLISQTTGRIKLADFGLARSYMHPTHRCTHEIVTLWYRAPEVIMGSLDYTYSIDVWSIGCVMAELFTGGSPLFPTDSEVETLFQIFRMRGTPTPESWPGIVETCPDYCELWPKWKEDRGLQTMQQRNPEIPDWLNELALSCLRVTPTARATVAELMAHPWFKDVDDAWVAGEFFVCPGLHSDSQPIRDEAEPV
ncbi:hypothetical protein FOZ61_001544 [Perkinsus olseni]|uniref:Orotidine 5'-phosphate decarboxylase n=1 Tax=Perkinsus olseni TaxID=32597 RepID=A0A7J6LW55_PEROL|nr:hypothetical protein FOZ61_001544 [Perkinsus olseni]